MSLVLASGSPRRRQLLEMLGLEFRIVAPNVDETRGSSELPEEYVTRLAREKARVVAASLFECAPEDVVLEGGRVMVAGVPSKSLPLATVAAWPACWAGPGLSSLVTMGLVTVAA